MNYIKNNLYLIKIHIPDNKKGENMTYKFSKSDVYRTTDTIVSLGNIYEAQYLIRGMNKIGEYEGQNYWNCFDIYEYNGIRFLHGEGVSVSDNFSHKIMKETGINIDKAYYTCSSTDEYRSKIKELLDTFCNSINKGIHDPSPILNFNQYKKNLYEQHNFYPEKPLLQIAQELNKYIPEKVPTNRGMDWKKVDAKEKVNSGFNRLIKLHNLNDINDKEKILEKVLNICITDYSKTLNNKNFELSR